MKRAARPQAANGARNQRVCDRFAVWLGGALLVHVALLGTLQFYEAGRHPPVNQGPRFDELTIELSEAPSEAVVAAPTHGLTEVARELSPARSGARSPTPSSLPSRVMPSAGEGLNSVGALSDEVKRAASDEEVALAGPAVAAAPVAQTAPLSLDALGVGSQNRFVERGATRRPRDARREGLARFQKSMAQELALAEHASGLGVAGPVLTQLEAATRRENAPLNASAVFLCSVDAAGKLIGVELAQSSTEPKAWQRVARSTEKLLKKHTFKLPKTGRGIAVRIRVTSRVQLPSGAAPGVNVSVLGIPIQRGSGANSGSVDILNILPQFRMERTRLPSGQSLDTPSLELGKILSTNVDPVDLGAPPQRYVRAHVESLKVTD